MRILCEGDGGRGDCRPALKRGCLGVRNAVSYADGYATG